MGEDKQSWYNRKLGQNLSESQDHGRCLLGAGGGLDEPPGSRNVCCIGNLTFQITVYSSLRTVGEMAGEKLTGVECPL